MQSALDRTKLFVIAAICAGLSALVLAPSAQAADRNHDGINDRWERSHGLSLKVNQANRDQDGDGVKNRCEFQAGTDPLDVDSDNDSTRDGHEDADKDGVDNGNESRERTKCNRKDSDRDHKRDGAEDADRDGMNNFTEDQTGNDPIDADTDNDGDEDGEEHAGVITSFDGTTLVLTLADNTTFSAALAPGVEIECETESENEHNQAGAQQHGAHASKSGDDEADDDNNDEDQDDDRDGVFDDEEGDSDNVCGVTDLLPGTIVHEAEVKNGLIVELELLK
jgi:hypothetical protein